MRSVFALSFFFLSFSLQRNAGLSFSSTNRNLHLANEMPLKFLHEAIYS